ncbi:MAG: hypothetical protein KJ804_03470 [Proteobacteria bacterium]|nr:hypothetical protein [Pseudomonadota bacterium]MBU1057363.1 hypothetical protein [Pseudomonadota bacterium]
MMTCPHPSTGSVMISSQDKQLTFDSTTGTPMSIVVAGDSYLFCIGAAGDDFVVILTS